MKKLGLIGGVGPMSTLDYYTGINEGYQERASTGGNPPMLIESLDLSVAYDLVEREKWDEFTDLFVAAAHNLHRAGAHFGAIAANTAHIVFERIAARSPLPLISIVDQTALAAEKMQCKSVIILGTRFTMKSGLYTRAFEERGIACHAPTAKEQDAIHGIIFPNLQQGIIDPEQKSQMLSIAKDCAARHQSGAIILGCTEIPLILKQEDVALPLLDTTKIHIAAILDEILAFQPKKN